MVDSETGRRRKYCRRSCRQRAYEHRTLLEGTAIPEDAVILSAADVADLGDRMFALRCAAEDLATAIAETEDRATLTALAGELLRLASEAERIR
ncbi:MAG: hypothetical protein QM658_12605 [Gordonia sp. (in: high G+C Gram-positive bacteria)]